MSIVFHYLFPYLFAHAPCEWMFLWVLATFLLTCEGTRDCNRACKRLSHKAATVYLHINIDLVTQFTYKRKRCKHQFFCNFRRHQLCRPVVRPDLTSALSYRSNGLACLTLSWIELYLIYHSPFHPICLATSPIEI